MIVRAISPFNPRSHPAAIRSDVSIRGARILHHSGLFFGPRCHANRSCLNIFGTPAGRLDEAARRPEKKLRPDALRGILVRSGDRTNPNERVRDNRETKSSFQVAHP
jgi:hypothetical protein